LEIRNVAIIAHVDHGKTTLVDKMLAQTGTFRANQEVQERVMDSNDLERERGITILAKNTSVFYKETKINIIDTPGHADFGGEVERTLSMADGALLLVDAFDGPMPQTRFVLRKALEMGLAIVVVINKIDRAEARPLEVESEVLELFFELASEDDHVDFPVVYASARDGYASLSPDARSGDLSPLFETILETVPAPHVGDNPLPRMLISSMFYDEYLGRLAIGRVYEGAVAQGMVASVCREGSDPYRAKVGQLFSFSGLKRTVVDRVEAGDIAVVGGLGDFKIGDTLAVPERPLPIIAVLVDEPTLQMSFSTNNSPFVGLEGDYVTSRHLRDRLMKELEVNVALRVEETDSPDVFEVSGRGELHLSILIENMRREGFEFQVSRPQVIFRETETGRQEPLELLTVDVPEEYIGVAMERLGSRRGEMLDMHTMGDGTNRIKFRIPSRGLVGLRSELMTQTRGTAVVHHVFEKYGEYRGELPQRANGALVAFEQGETTGYGLYNAQERGELFIEAGVKVYSGMVVGQTPKEMDIDVNVCRKKQLTNMRSSGADDALRLVPPRELTLEWALEFINDDELVEITPQTIRLRKAILDANLRRRASR